MNQKSKETFDPGEEMVDFTSTPPEEKMMVIQCPHCQKDVVMSESPRIYQKLSCPHCKKWFAPIKSDNGVFTFYYLKTPKAKIPGKKKRKK